MILAILAAANSWQYTPDEKAGTEDVPEVESAETKVAPAEEKKVNNISAPSLSYTQAVVVFAKERIQFDENCKVTPDLLRVKSGKTTMFDNRSRDAVSFSLDGTDYVIPGYGFRLLQLSSSNPPHVAELDCGDGQGKGRIIVE